MRGASIALLLLLSACAGRYAGSSWNGRRGYDGQGDYGYDVNASRAEAQGYRARASRSYPVPGSLDDPWGPYIREAASRYAVPERWIRGVMHQESGGQLWAADGSLTTSSVGARGLMQVMPSTYDTLRQRYGLGDDAYEPHDNVMAGAAYIREIFDRFGAPAFLAAYNAGPERLDAYLAGTAELPDETTNYLVQVAPRLGSEVAMTGPLAVYAAGTPVEAAMPGGTSNGVYAGGALALPAEDPANHAFDGGGLVTALAPTGILTRTGQTAPDHYRAAAATAVSEPPSYARQDGGSATPGATAYVSPVSMLVPAAMARAAGSGAWAIQVGAFPDPTLSSAVAAAAQSRAGALLAGVQPAIAPVQHGGGTLYRARLVGLSEGRASAACTALSREGISCFTVPPGS